MQVFDINIAPGASRQIDVQASYIYFLNGSAGGADTTIGFRPEAGSETVYLKPGQAYKLPTNVRIGQRWTMFNLKNEAAIVGQVLMGEGEFSDNRVSGSVEVISGERSRTLAGTAYVAYGNASVNAGMLPHQQLWNPIGSGKNLIVGKVIVSSSTAQPVRVGPYNVALPTLDSPPQSKRLNGGTASVAQSRLHRATAAVLDGGLMFNLQIPVGVSTVLTMIEPVLIPPGCGLMTVGTQPSSDLPTNFEYYEEAI